MSVRIDTIRTGITNTYLLREEGAVLVEPGGPLKGAAVLQKLTPILGDPRQIRLIIATHGHFDHIGAAAELHEALGAPVAIHAGDAEWLRNGEIAWPLGVTRWAHVMRAVLHPLVTAFLRVPALQPDILIGDEGLDLAEYGVTGRVVHTPGHSPGSVSVLLPGGEALVGDLAMNGPPMCLRPRFGIFAHQPELVPASWRRLLELGARTVYPAHGRPFPATALPVVG